MFFPQIQSGLFSVDYQGILLYEADMALDLLSSYSMWQQMNVDGFHGKKDGGRLGLWQRKT
jgi:hypothetical protein